MNEQVSPEHRLIEGAVAARRDDGDRGLAPGVLQADHVAFAMNRILRDGRQGGKHQQACELHGFRCYQTVGQDGRDTLVRADG